MIQRLVNSSSSTDKSSAVDLEAELSVAAIAGETNDGVRRTTVSSESRSRPEWRDEEVTRHPAHELFLKVKLLTGDARRGINQENDISIRMNWFRLFNMTKKKQQNKQNVIRVDIANL